MQIEFLKTKNNGLVLHVSIPKSPKVHYTAGGDCFIRVNAQKKKIKGERITQLSYSKGAAPYERKAVETAELSEILTSPRFERYRQRIATNLDSERFLHKQRLLSKKDEGAVPNVCCVLLFDEESQATLDTRCFLKVYRLSEPSMLNTSESNWLNV